MNRLNHSPAGCRRCLGPYLLDLGGREPGGLPDLVCADCGDRLPGEVEVEMAVNLFDLHAEWLAENSSGWEGRQ